MTPILYLLLQNYSNEPLINEFLFGDYASRPYPPTAYWECEDGSTVNFSKNTTRFPKIIGCLNPGVPTDLMLDLRNHVTAKWREIRFSQPFSFGWDCDGFEIIEQYEASRAQELDAAGIVDRHEQANHILTDEGLIYLDLVERFRVQSFVPKTAYWEMILVNSYRTVEVDAPTNVLVFSKTAPLVRRVSGNFERDSLEDSVWPMSIDGLYEHQMLSLHSGAYALTRETIAKMKPWIESDYYTVRPIFESDITPDR